MHTYENTVNHYINQAILMYNKGFTKTAANYKKLAVSLATEKTNNIFMQKVINRLKVIK